MPKTYDHIQDPGLRAVREAVTARELAEHLGVTPQNIGLWKQVPYHWVLPIEDFVGVPRYVQRPDLYPPEDYEEVLNGMATD